MLRIRLSSYCTVLFLLIGCGQPPSGGEPATADDGVDMGLDIRPVNDRPLPEPYATEHARNHSEVVSRPDGAEITVPEGFTVTQFATGDFKRPRFMLLGPGNEILISDSDREAGAVYVMQDTDGDGVEDTRHTLISGLFRPYGLAWWNEYLYVTEPTSVKRWIYNPTTMQVEGDGETIVQWPEDFSKSHWTRTILFNRAGTRMYVTVGSGSNVDHGGDPRRAALNVYDPDGSNHEIFATGLRNIIGLDFYPGTEEIWGAVQERDAIGDDLVADYFTTIRKGQFFGWPYSYTGPHADPRRDERPDLVPQTRYPDVLMPTHAAVLDIEFYTADQFPEEYRGGCFIAFHGSWNRADRLGYSIEFVPFTDGRPTAGPTEFMGGFMTAPDVKEVWGRPVGIMTMPDGSLLISDDGGKLVWRVSYTG